MIDRQYRLNWPIDEPRTPTKRSSSPFSMPLDRAIRELDTELKRFKAINVVLSHNDNRRSVPREPGAALFFKLGTRDISICCDLYPDVGDNIRAILKIVQAMRTIERYGGQHLSQKSFTGFVALPAPKDVWQILGISKGVGEALSPKMKRDFVMEAFRDRVKEGHGAGADMSALTEARDEALKQLGVA
jgi:hypothetical protein